MKYYEEYKVELPERTDSKYKAIEKFEDYEFTYCIAYEMAIRTKEFEELVNIRIENHNETTKKKFFSLGIREFDSCPLVTEKGELLKKQESFYKLDVKNWFTYTLDNIINGYGRLLAFYLNKNKVFKKIDNEFIPVKNSEFLYVYYGNDDYFIPSFKEGADNYICIRKDMPLKILEKEFLSELKLSDLALQYIQTEPIYSRPTLRFEEDRIINLPINLNLSGEELSSYILKVKMDYKNEKSIVKNFIEDFLDVAIDDPEKAKSYKKIPKTNLKKEAIADAFFVHDWFSILIPRYKKLKLCSNKITSTTLDGLALHLSYETEIGIDLIKAYRTFMNSCINDKLYIDLIKVNHNSKYKIDALANYIEDFKRKYDDRMKNKKRKTINLTENDKKNIDKMNEDRVPQREIARVLKKPYSTVNSYIHRSNKKI